MKGSNIRLLLIGLVIIIVCAVVFMRGDQLVELAETMKQGSTLPLVAAICTQLGKYLSQSFAYSHCFKAVNETMKPRSTLPLVFGTFFMNTIAPSLNLAGTTLVVNDARKRGIEAGKATSAALLMQITIDGAFATIMIIGFIMLALTVGLSPLWFLVGMLVIVLVSVMVLVMVLGRKRPAVVLRILSPIERLINSVLVRFKKKPLKPWAGRLVTSFSDAAGLIVQNPRPALEAYACSIVASICELSCFCLVGVAFGVTSIEPLVCGYVVATLFAMISITPQGVGVVEAMVVVAFTAFGESSAAGMAIGLVYRGIVFWMPFVIGAILINATKTFRGGEKGKGELSDVQERSGGDEGAKRRIKLPDYHIPTLSQQKVTPLKTEVIEERTGDRPAEERD
ncbi:MAG: lysylphosphatidylglycerol synthase transmembrane domain-containing protein [Eggerthellaceae bacterium]|nr:lysylphosphatidylglycerol synthase transmembrane domain-containing protein [Eggerthellaceae bacterium]